MNLCIFSVSEKNHFSKKGVLSAFIVFSYLLIRTFLFHIIFKIWKWGTNNTWLPDRWRHVAGRVRKLSMVYLHNNAFVERCILVTRLHCGPPELHHIATYIVSSVGTSLTSTFISLEPDRGTVTACTGRTLSISCGDASRILIDKAWYGWSASGPSDGECYPGSRDLKQHVETVPTILMNMCMGQRKCSLNVVAVSMKNCISRRHCTSSYQMVKYICVKGEVFLQ